VTHFRGMFSFALWDAPIRLSSVPGPLRHQPFYYLVNENVLYFASEIKQYYRSDDRVEVDVNGIKDYLTFSSALPERPFSRVFRNCCGPYTDRQNGSILINRYWEVYFNLDFDHTAGTSRRHFASSWSDSVRVHLRSMSHWSLRQWRPGLEAHRLVGQTGKRASTSSWFHWKFNRKDYDEHRIRGRLRMEWIPLHEIGDHAAGLIDNIGKYLPSGFPCGGTRIVSPVHGSQLGPALEGVLGRAGAMRFLGETRAT